MSVTLESRLRAWYSRLPVGWQKWIKSVALYWQGAFLLGATLTGFIPSYRVRRFLYRRFFRIRIGDESVIYWQCRFFAPRSISIGDNTFIGNNAFLDGRCGLTIGNRVITASEVAIYTLQHDINDPKFAHVGAPVVIEDYVYIGPRAIILPGVKIGRGAVVGAGAVVTADVEAYTFVGGVPARFIRHRPMHLEYLPSYRMPFQ